VHEDARDVARAWMGKPEFDKSRDERKRVEMRFAHLKTHHRFERMRLRASPVHATSSTSLRSCTTSRRLRTISGDHRRTRCARPPREPQLQSIEFMPSPAGGIANEAKTAAKGPR
jgi:hypothetical protein